MKNGSTGLRALQLILLTTMVLFGGQGLARVQAAPGDLDFSFGIQGRQVIHFYGENPSSFAFEVPRQMLIQPDGKILVVGYASGATYDMVLGRLNPNGSLDLDFGVNGKVFLSFEQDYDWGQAIALQPDGKILIGGETRFHQIPATRNTRYALARLNPDGTLDEDFGAGGKVITDFFQFLDSITNIVVLPSGKIVASGYVSNGADNTSAFDFGLVGLNANGTVDTSFGTGGKTVTDFAGDRDMPVRSFALPDGKILVAGSAGLSLDVNDFALARYNADGKLDTTFDGDGKLMTGFPGGASDTMTSAAMTRDGKLVAVGWTTHATFGPSDYAVMRFNLDGSLDTSFDGDGMKAIDVGNSPDMDRAAGVAVQQNGKIVITGDSPLFQRTGGSDRDHTVMRLNQDGSIDTGFGTNGRVFVDFGVLQHNPSPATGFIGENGDGDVAIQPEGKIVITGTFRYVGRRNFGVARLLGDPVAANRRAFDFDGDGRADVSVFRPASGTWYLNRSQGGFTSAQFGLQTDVLAPADYDGDGRTDVAVFRSGTWYLQRSSSGFASHAFGAAGDLALPADMDGDGRAELGVYRPSSGVWYFFNLVTNQSSTMAFGQTGDRPLTGDFDGDGRDDLAVYRGGVWYLQQSQAGFLSVQFGDAADRPVAADFDGDGRADLAVFRPTNGTWYLRQSQLGFAGISFGLGTDTPVAADYDGDGKADLAVYRGGAWYIRQSQSGLTSVQFGAPDDLPVAGAYMR